MGGGGYVIFDVGFLCFLVAVLALGLAAVYGPDGLPFDAQRYEIN
jgi:hypothetical protein